MKNTDQQPKTRQQRFLSHAAMFDEVASLPLFRQVILIIVVALLVLVIWAGFARVDETARAFGHIVPQGNVRVVQHLDGGIVSEVLVKNGDKVEQDKTVLLRLDPVNELAELEQIEQRQLALQLDAERLRAFVAERDERLSTIKPVLTGHRDIPEAEHQRVLSDERLLFKLQNDARKDQRDVINAQVAQRQEQAQQLLAQKKNMQTHLDLLIKEKNMYQGIDTFSKRDFLEITRQLNKANGDYLTLLSKIRKNQQALFEAKNRLSELNSTLKRSAFQQLDSINSELIELQQTLKRLRTRYQRRTVIAHVSGVVNDLRVAPGSVVAAGGELLEIVPTDRRLVVEAEINPRDIGHIRPGDHVTVKVQTYEFARYGSIPGILASISPNVLTDDNNRHYYRAIIELKKNYVGDNPAYYQVLPGMAVEANITTDSKTILQYLLRPIHGSLSRAFHER